MSRINIAELQPNQSEFNVLSIPETDLVYGGRRAIRNSFTNVQIASIIQVNNNVTVQIAFGGSNINISNLTNNAGVNQTITNR